MPLKKVAIGSAVGALEPDLTPLSYMLRILRDPDSTSEERRWAATQAAPFCHAKMVSVDHTGDVVLHHDESGDELG